MTYYFANSMGGVYLRNYHYFYDPGGGQDDADEAVEEAEGDFDEFDAAGADQEVFSDQQNGGKRNGRQINRAESGL